MAMSSTIWVLCAFFALSAAVASAAHSAPAPGADCTNLVLNMAGCLSYVTVGGTAKKPEGGCCSGLKTVLKTDPECLCEAFKNSAQFGVTLNVTKAMALPAACHLSAPSVGNCAASIAPGAAPALSPMVPLSPSSSIAGAPGAGSGATEGAPVPTPGSSGSSALTTSIEFLVVTTMVAAAALSFALF